MAAPNTTRTTVTIDGLGEMHSGFYEGVSWSSDAMTGPRVHTGDELAQAKHQADFYGDLNYVDRYSLIETLSRETFAGQAVYKVRRVNLSEVESFVYFSVDSGLLVGMEATAETQMGKVPVVTELRDYIDVSGMLQPTTMLQNTMGIEQRMAWDTIEANVADVPSLAPPSDIQAILDEAAASGEAAAAPTGE
jgi:hypothetical protein